MVIALVLHVALAFQDRLPVADTIVRTAVQEAAAIWAPYGLSLNRTAACDTPSSDTRVLAVEAVDGVALGRAGLMLGAVVFGPDGTPEPRISLFLDAILQIVASTHMLNAPESEWPRLLRELIIGRALGRVLAHEIGHYVLRNRRHAAAGLMRPLQRSDELVAPSRATFRLSPAEAAQLRLSPGQP